MSKISSSGSLYTVSGRLLRTTIKDELTSEWPSFTGEQNFPFWEHEWDRHGTCSGLESLAYFKRVLKCRKRFGGILGLQNYKEILNRSILPRFSEFTPGAPKQHYSLIAFHDGLREALGNLSPQLKCNIRNGGYQLEEVNICFDPEPEKPINYCSSTIPKFISCGRNERAQLFFADEKTLVKKAGPTRFPSFLNGFHYWWGGMVFSFDMSNEVFREILPPPVERATFEDIAIINDSLTLVLIYAPLIPRAHLWVMNESGVERTWTKTFTIRQPGDPEFFNLLHFRDDGLVFLCRDPEDCVVLYDPRTQEQRKLEIFRPAHLRIVSYMETLVSVNVSRRENVLE
ncbi:Intracellular ribonuclease LX [Morella rubra]|uniref:Intracellular ribonuclease LX n=1 Tax=Morella rubra TaxID=262757 RepID=A0A6A1VID2_9ROSI|nr:Intracellular ribonuclease LX [Morella rubra]